MEEGSIVANLASDLGLSARSLAERELKLDILHSKKYLGFNKETGELYILEKIDREYLCNIKTSSCLLKLDVIIKNPIRIFNIEFEILDINDHAPHFRRETMHLDISESASPIERFSLNNAVDPDVGSNSIKTYALSESDHFKIEIQTGSDGSKYVDLVLTKALDREVQAVHNLILTAVDGGLPARSGTASIIVNVLDTNDNAPQFDHQVYSINITENSPIGTLVLKLNATDLDEGPNSEIMYFFTLYTSEKTQEMFGLNPNTGDIKVKDVIDFEEIKILEMHIQAKDQGHHPLTGQCTVMVYVEDVNDNYPEITVKSLRSTVKENVPIGTVIALVGIHDRDSGDNGKVDLSIGEQLPFVLNKSSESNFELVVSESLDRETVPEYNIILTVTDRGIPPFGDKEGKGCSETTNTEEWWLYRLQYTQEYGFDRDE
ncbi:hypothetical protein JZ751_006870 [Albula glossodonta]|uniref:Cadherin domain-containing protein n=1 Tax=Albula glossodonta TaxID=121402 RepID=A0A8T2P2L8_9TELE|nr:hypothetical protein JZ751_006870 [Albula glossodonta]